MGNFGPALRKWTSVMLCGIAILHFVNGQTEETPTEMEKPLDLTKVSAAELKFSSRLYKILRGIEEENLIYSPLVLHLALASLKAAAAGDTLSELNIATGFSKMDNEMVQNGYQDLIDLLKSDEYATVKLINRIFTSNLFKADGNYAYMVREKFNGHVNSVDFSNTTIAAEKINSYVASFTNGTIKNFISADSLEPTHRVVMLNSLYFKSEWEREFTPLMTQKHPFIAFDGTESEVFMMHRGGIYPYAEIVELNSTALSIPYKGNRFSLNFILPARGIPITQLEKNLESFPMPTVLSRMSERYIQVSVPRFTLESHIDMIGPLQMLGVKTLLSPHANLTKMSRKHGLYVSSVIQRAFLSVSEGGSDVSASSFIEAVPVTPRFLVPFTLDRPFICFLYDNATDTILFVGKKLQ